MEYQIDDNADDKFDHGNDRASYHTTEGYTVVVELVVQHVDKDQTQAARDGHTPMCIPTPQHFNQAIHNPTGQKYADIFNFPYHKKSPLVCFDK